MKKEENRRQSEDATKTEDWRAEKLKRYQRNFMVYAYSYQKSIRRSEEVRRR